jgi:hypothetical protein
MGEQIQGGNEMKCDELKAYVAGFDGILHKNQRHGDVYLKDDVDAAIAELKQKLEDVKASAYAESVDAGMRERRLRRALWIARAQRANDKARIFYFAETCGVKLNIDGYSNREKGHTRMCTARWWRLTWLKVERKCLKKAEEYK